MAATEHFLAAGNRLGESPLWHAAEEALYWVDIEGENFHRYHTKTDKLDTFQVGQPVGCLAFRVNGGLLMGLRDGIGFWDWDTQSINIIANPEADRKGARFNDGKVDKQGRFWAGTIGEDQGSNLFRFDPDGSIHTMETGISISNGIGWSPDDKIMYYTDSPLRVVYAYDFDSESGSWDGWRITRYDPEGKVERVIPLPVQRPTSCTFGGAELNQLYITSARTGLDEADRRKQPLAGNLLRIQTEVTGQEENKYLG